MRNLLIIFTVFLQAAQYSYCQTSGFASFYGGPQDNTSPYVASFGLSSGSCGYGVLDQSEWPYWQAAAIGPGNALYSTGNQKGCGKCIQATCTQGCVATASPLIVLVTDTCDDCAANQLNVHSLAFQQHFQPDLTQGEVGITYQQVECNPPGNIVAVVSRSRASDGGFLVVTLQQVAGSGTIQSIEIQGSGGTYQPMTNAFGCAWQASNLGQPPFSLRIVGGNSQTLIASNAITAVQDGKYPTQVQFTSSGTSQTSPPLGGAAVQNVPPPSQLSNQNVPPPFQTAIPPSPQPTQTATPNTPPPRVAVPITRPSNPQQTSSPEPSPTPAVTGRAPAPSPARSAPVPSPPRLSSAPTQSPARNSTAPGPARNVVVAASSVTPAPSPLKSNITSPAPAPSANQTRAPAANASMAPGTTQLSVNTGLNSSQANAANAIVNPQISVSGRRLQYFKDNKH